MWQHLIVGDFDPDGPRVVLLHGYAETAEDMIPLGRVLAAAGLRVFIPQAPELSPDGGRQWWSLDPADRPSHTWTDEQPPGYQARPSVTAARTGLIDFIAGIPARPTNRRISVVGFSQGAMLALDVGLTANSGVRRAAALSGVLLADSLPALADRHPESADHYPERAEFFLAHGRSDPEIHFDGGRAASHMLQRHSFPVEWHPFDGGHDIPDTVRDQLVDFLTRP